jgi:hypothetical protein
MRLYLDDDSVSGLLIRLLNNAGHDVEIPADGGLSGQDDAMHLTPPSPPTHLSRAVARPWPRKTAESPSYSYPLIGLLAYEARTISEETLYKRCHI